MKIFTSADELLKVSEKKVALTIGNFDGVHLGHQYLLKKILAECEANDHQLAVMSFVPHPHEILFPEKKHFLLNDYDDRRIFLKELGIPFFIEQGFNRDFSTLKPEEFLEKYLLIKKGKKGFSKFYLGQDFAFGAQKSGDFEFVKNYCKDLSIEVELLDLYKEADLKVSSSRVREELIDGNVDKAEDLLGRPYFFKGTVIKGDGRGKTLGFPTANIIPDRKRIYPSRGVYITSTVFKGGTYHSITNVGVKPTFGDKDEVNIETNIFDFDQDIYGEVIEVHFHKLLRGEIKFSSVNHLIEQIGKDILTAKEYFK